MSQTRRSINYFFLQRACCERPSLSVRRQVAQGRVEKLNLERIVVPFGPLTKQASSEKDLKEALSDINELRKVVESLRAENVVLKSQLLRFENLSQDSNRLEFLFVGSNSGVTA